MAKPKKVVVPEILRAAMRDALMQEVAFPLEVVRNEDIPTVDRLAAWELLAKYGIGQQKEVKGDIQHTHGVVHLPPLAAPPGNLQLGAGGSDPDEIEVTE